MYDEEHGPAPIFHGHHLAHDHGPRERHQGTTGNSSNGRRGENERLGVVEAVSVHEAVLQDDGLGRVEMFRALLDLIDSLETWGTPAAVRFVLPLVTANLARLAFYGDPHRSTVSMSVIVSYA